MVRDAIATVLSRAIDYAGEEFFSFGLATPWVIEQVSTLVASWSARIGRWMTALRDSVGPLTSAMDRLGQIIEALKKLLRDDRGSIGGDPIKPKGTDPGPRTNSAPKPGADWLIDARSKLPPEWGDGSPNRKGVGTRWQDPNDPGSGVRIDRPTARRTTGKRSPTADWSEPRSVRLMWCRRRQRGGMTRWHGSPRMISCARPGLGRTSVASSMSTQSAR